MATAISPLILRGMGETPSIITRGFIDTAAAAVAAAVAEAARRVKHGRVKVKELYEENFEKFLVQVALTSVNDEYLTEPIIGKVEKKLMPIDLVYSVTEIVVRHLKQAGKKIHITIKRVIRGGM